MKNILIIEPTWPDLIHCPGNAGLISIAAKAFPDYKITYVGEKKQCGHVSGLLDPEIANSVNFIQWDVWQDSPHLWSDQWRRRRAIDQLPSGLLIEAEIILLSSVTATILNEITWRGLAKRSFACLHGNANDFFGWRSRNPLRRFFDFTSASRRFVESGAKFLVMEQRIADVLEERLPFLIGAVACLPHPLISSEMRPKEFFKTLGQPISIGFAGNASLPKGFYEFSEFAQRLSRSLPGCFEFHAIGFLPDESRSIDQSLFATQATQRRLERAEFNGLLGKIDFMFQWHADAYYELSASGVVYDAINLGIPLLARYGAEIKSLQDAGKSIGLAAESVDELVEYFLSKYASGDLTQDHAICQENLLKIRAELTEDALATQFRKIVPAS